MKFQKLLIMVALWLAVIQPFFAERPADWHESTKIKSILTLQGEKAELPRGLVHCVAYAESRFIPTARSKLVDTYRSCGIMQLYRKYIVSMVETYSSNPDVFDWTNPSDNAEVGCEYLSYLIHKFGGSVWLGLCAYNMGESDLSHIKSLDDIPQNCKDYADGILTMLDQWDESW